MREVGREGSEENKGERERMRKGEREGVKGR